MSRNHIPGMAAQGNASHERQQSSLNMTAASSFSMSSPPGLNMSMQNLTNNSAAHSFNMIPGLAFGSPPAPSQSGRGALAHFQPRQASNDLERTHTNVTSQSDWASLTAKIPLSRAPEIPNHPPELSEGEFEEFEDLYEPKDQSDKVRSANSTQGRGSIGDADDSSIYDNNTPRLDAADDTARRVSSADEEWEPSLNHSVGSGSYSPPQNAATTQGPSAVPGIPMARNDNAPMIAEAKKKAQEAILALWPLKVRYQNYIDEGFDENVVNALFKELGLATPATKSTQPAARRASGVSEVASSSNGAANTNNAKDGGVSGKPRVKKVSGQDPLSEGHVSEDKQPQLRSAKSAAEERKDKIARKLAAKAQKPSTTMAVSEPPVAKVAVAATAKVKTRAETNALLHQKLAALKKTQEKAAADRLAATAAVAVKDETASEPLQSADKGHPLNPTPPIPTLPLAGQSSEPTREAQSKTTAESLARSIMPATESVRALKRPVASDFDNYPSYLDGSLKRTRTQDTLIIDVSDEDEDDDVEMEIGSPTDEQEDYASSHNDNTPATTGGLHMTQSGEAVAQPAAERASTAPAPEGRGKLHLLRGKIEEMRRRIAEAEAKKTGKTPVQTEPSSPQSPSMPSNAMGLALPKLSKLRREPQQHDHVRDGRVMSVELLLVESDLRAKQEKLKTIVAEAARLELEIQDALAQKQKLSSEMEHFDNNAGSEPNTASRLQSPVEDAAPTRQPLSSESTNIQQNDLEQKASTNPATVSAGIEATSNTDVVGLYQDEPNQHESQRSSISTHQDAEPSTEEAASHSSQGGPTSMEISTGEDRDGTDEDDDISMSADDDDSEDSDSDQSMEAAVEAGPLIEPVPEDETSTSPKDHDAAQVKVTSVNKTQGHDAAAACPASSSATETLKDNAAVEPDDVRNLEAQQVAIQEDSEQQSVNDHVDDATESFSSYHSPLGYFRAYRFHPTFLDKVPGGLKSLTYSSKIDVEQMLCPSESDGQECPDPECEYQHFRKMVLPDGDIITQLGSADMFSGETKIQFIAGLRKTLQELKVNKVKDFDRITKAIVQYRADFLADKSKILPLNGVQL